MTWDSYCKFKEVINKNETLNKKYYVQEIDSIDDYVELPKLRINGTTYIEELYKDWHIHQGIYIDIFILHKTGKSIFSRVKQHFSNQYLVLKSLSNKKYSKKASFLMKFLRLFPYNFLRKNSLKNLYKYEKNNSANLYFYDTDIRGFKKSFCDVSEIFPPVLHNFEGVDLFVPKKYEDYLSRVYGDYMSVPSMENIRDHQHSAYWSVDEDFKKYLKVNDDYFDERRGYNVKR